MKFRVITLVLRVQVDRLARHRGCFHANIITTVALAVVVVVVVIIPQSHSSSAPPAGRRRCAALLSCPLISARV